MTPHDEAARALFLEIMEYTSLNEIDAHDELDIDKIAQALAAVERASYQRGFEDAKKQLSNGLSA